MWKEFLTEFLEESIAMLNPALHEAVDWSIPPQYLEQELLNALKGKYKIKNKRKFTDKLVRLTLKSGKDHYILLHAEAQHEPEDAFSKRMYIYRSLIYLRYDIDDITAIAIFTGAPPDAASLLYKHDSYGTELTYKYNSYICVQQDEQVLLKSENPFAIATLAAIYAFQTKNDSKKRFTFKRELFKLAEKKKMPREKLLKLLIFVKEFLHLPEKYENEFQLKYYTKILNSIPMYTWSKGTVAIFDEAFVRLTGKGIEEYKAEIKAMAKAKKEYKRQTEELLLKFETESKKSAEEREQTIWNFHTVIGLPDVSIAKAMNLKLQYVQDIIAKNQTASK